MEFCSPNASAPLINSTKTLKYSIKALKYSTIAVFLQ